MTSQKFAALEYFAKSGLGSYEAVSDEFLSLYRDASTPVQIKLWIDRLGTFLLGRHNLLPDDYRRAPIDTLHHLLVPHESPRQFIHFYARADLTSPEIQAAADHVEALVDRLGTAFAAFLTLADVDGGADNLAQTFDEFYIDEFTDRHAAMSALTEIDEVIESVERLAQEHGLESVFTYDEDKLNEIFTAGYDLVELRGRMYVFIK
ncbi:hypothetical protein [Subtercola frigoramans]|nr:hypothetical protein [Subtercola frigoramans]